MSGCKCSCSHDEPTKVLKNEHRVIERVLDAMERRLAREPFDPEFFWQAIDFLRNFADGCHHHKEEEQLFPMLQRLGVPAENGPIGCMLADHDVGRDLIQQMLGELPTASTEPASLQRFDAAAAKYIKLLRAHIWKEDNGLFSIADTLLDRQARRELSDAFERVENAEERAGKHEMYLRIADDLFRRAFNEEPPALKGNCRRNGAAAANVKD